MKTISLKQTLFLKIFLPLAWVVLAGTGTLGAWMGWFQERYGSSMVDLKWFSLAIMLLGTPVVVWFSLRLKRVRMDSNQLLISSFSRETAITFDMIADVKENVAVTNLHPITVYLKQPTVFGRTIFFLTPFRLSGWSSQPIADELRALSRSASRRA